MKRIHLNKKKTILTAAIAIPVIVAAFLIPKAVKAKKRGRYASI